MNVRQWHDLEYFIQDCPAEILWHDPLRIFAGRVVRGDKYILRMNEYEGALSLRNGILSAIDSKLNVKAVEIQGEMRFRTSLIPIKEITTQQQEKELIRVKMEDDINNLIAAGDVENLEDMIEAIKDHRDTLIANVNSLLKPDVTYEKCKYKTNARAYKLSYYDVRAGRRKQAGVGDVFIASGDDIELTGVGRTKPRTDRIDQRTDIEIAGCYYVEVDPDE